MGFGLALNNDNGKSMADYKNDNWEEYNLFGSSDDLKIVVDLDLVLNLCQIKNLLINTIR